MNDLRDTKIVVTSTIVNKLIQDKPKLFTDLDDSAKHAILSFAIMTTQFVGTPTVYEDAVNELGNSITISNVSKLSNGDILLDIELTVDNVYANQYDTSIIVDNVYANQYDTGIITGMVTAMVTAKLKGIRYTPQDITKLSNWGIGAYVVDKFEDIKTDPKFKLLLQHTSSAIFKVKSEDKVYLVAGGRNKYTKNTIETMSDIISEEFFGGELDLLEEDLYKVLYGICLNDNFHRNKLISFEIVDGSLVKIKPSSEYIFSGELEIINLFDFDQVDNANTILTTESGDVELDIDHLKRVELDIDHLKRMAYVNKVFGSYTIDLENPFVIDTLNLNAWQLSVNLDDFEGVTGIKQWGHVKDVAININTISFHSNSALELDVPDTFPSNVTNINDMFYGLLLKTTSAANWDMSNVITINSLFYECDISKFNGKLVMGTVKNTIDMFTNIDLSSDNAKRIIENLDVVNIKTMFGMFKQSSTNNTLDLSKWDVSNVTAMNKMFYEFEGILKIGNWDTGNVRDMDKMFWGSRIKSALDLSGWNVKHVPISDIENNNWDINNIKNPVWGTIDGVVEESVPKGFTISSSYGDTAPCSVYHVVTEDVVDHSGIQGLIYNLEQCAIRATILFKSVVVDNGYIVYPVGYDEAYSHNGRLSKWWDDKEPLLEGKKLVGVILLPRYNVYPDNLPEWLISTEYMFCVLVYNDLINEAYETINWDGSNIKYLDHMFTYADNTMCLSYFSNIKLENILSTNNMFSNHGIDDNVSVGKLFKGTDLNKSNLSGMFRDCIGSVDEELDLAFACVSGIEKRPVDFYKPHPKIPVIMYMGMHDITEPVWGTCPDVSGELVYVDGANGGKLIRATSKYMVGETHELDGKEYLVVSTNMFKSISNNWDGTYDVDGHTVTLDQLVTTFVTNMDEFAYYDTDNTDLPIGQWDTSNVTSMKGMFHYHSSANIDLSNWDVSNVTDMYNMFRNCNNFNQDISGWDVSNVTDMNGMFSGCVEFNQPLDKWNVSNVTDMSNMFNGCVKFNQDLSAWDVDNVNVYEDFDAGAISWTKPKPNFK